MLNQLTLYYFSPTGGTKTVALAFSQALAQQVDQVDLGARTVQQLSVPENAVIVVAAPVFAGRIPELVIDKLKTLQGKGIQAITLAVYGNRHYDDALLELNDTLQAAGCRVIASGACIAKHSLVHALAAGRPDAADMQHLQDFAAKVLDKLAQAQPSEVNVPGNRPYRDRKPAAAAPISTDSCVLCGRCADVCPTGAISVADSVVTDASRCILCVSCVAQCPTGARQVPAPVTEHLTEHLRACMDVRRESEFFL